MSAISRAREDRQKRKQKLYFNSAILIFFVAVLVVALLLVPYFPQLFFVGDIAMDVTVAFILLFWWTQWKQSVYLHIQNKFIQLLTSYEEKQRLTFMARISNLGRKCRLSHPYRHDPARL